MSIVYRHRRLDTFKVFYIGIGKTEKRAYSKKNRNKWWKNIILKTEYSVEIIIEDISWKEAQEVEVLLISEYGRRDLGLGNLVNLTNGGEGTQGIIVSDTTKQNMSISATGRKHSEESKEKNRIASSNVSEETKLKRYLKNKGKKRTFEQSKRISDAKTDKITKNSIIILDILTGVFYISLAQVCRIYDIPRGQLLGKLKGRSINDTNLIIV